MAGGNSGGTAAAQHGIANPTKSTRRECDIWISARRVPHHLSAINVNKTGATLADRSRVTILLLLRTSACDQALA
ncbi:hypothetical protein EYR26_21455 [Xanthomonas oryzae]|nr:hypothetical protein EYR26_21455 [Xanthomonas oryzae]